MKKIADPDCLGEANSILIRITTKLKAAVACLNEFILRNKFHYFCLKYREHSLRSPLE